MSKQEWIDKTTCYANDLTTFARLMREVVDRVKAGERVENFVMCEGRLVDCDPEWAFGPHAYSLKPKRTLRPWTAKEWGARIGDEFCLDGKRVKLVGIATSTLCFEGPSEHFPLPGPTYAAKQDDKTITQLDGSPCGEYV